MPALLATSRPSQGHCHQRGTVEYGTAQHVCYLWPLLIHGILNTADNSLGESVAQIVVIPHCRRVLGEPGRPNAVKNERRISMRINFPPSDNTYTHRKHSVVTSI